MKFQLNVSAQPSQENFLDGLVYFFKSDAKIESNIKNLIQKLSKIKDDELKSIFIKIRTYPCKTLQDCIKVMDVTFSATQEVVKYADEYVKAFELESSEDPTKDSADITLGDTPEAERAFDNLVKSMSKAGKTINNTVNVDKIDWTAINGSEKTLGELGYTKSVVEQISKKFSEDIRKNKTLFDLLDSINSDLDMAAMSFGDKDLTLYHECVKTAYSGFKVVDYFLFSLDRRIK